MTDLDPAVLRDDAIKFRGDNFYINDDDCQRAADALGLLADLLDAIGDPDDLRLWVHDINSIMLRGVARRIAAVLEAHRG